MDVESRRDLQLLEALEQESLITQRTADLPDTRQVN
jgi:hypothetical protein